MPYDPITNFKDSNGVDLGKKLVTKDYLLSVYGSILDSVPDTGLTVTPELWVWGRNSQGQLGINNTTGRTTPVTTFSGGTIWKSVSMGYAHCGAIKTDGSLWMWGPGTPIGSNSFFSRSTPITTFAGGNDWKQISCGCGIAQGTAAIKTDGTLWVWGTNSIGQLPLNLVSGDRITPVTTFAGGNNWKFVSTSGYNSAAIKTDGSLWVWGRNLSGNLGTNDVGARNTPVTTFLGGNAWKTVAVSQSHVLAIKIDGTLWSWGANSIYGQLGDNSTIGRSTPVTTFLGGNDWKSCAAINNVSAAIKTDGTLWTWGYGGAGQTAINTTQPRSIPVTTFAGGNNWKFVSLGSVHAAAIKTDGTLWVWGSPTNGALGLGLNDTVLRLTPVVPFLGGNNWKSVALGGSCSAAIKSLSDI